eukprot:gene7500-9216_t
MIKHLVKRSISSLSTRKNNTALSTSSFGRRTLCYYSGRNNQLPYNEEQIEDYSKNLNHAGKYAKDDYDKHQNIIPFYEKNSSSTPMLFGMYPKHCDNAFIAPSATVAGNVVLLGGASVWYNVVLKADVNLIHVGAYTNIQDGTIVREATQPLSINHNGSTIIGEYTTIGHSCILEACTVEDNCLVGMGSILEAGSTMESNSILGSHSILPKGAKVLSGQLWAGRPARYIRDLTQREIDDIHNQSYQYYLYGEEHRKDLGLYKESFLYNDAEKQGVTVGFKDDYFGDIEGAKEEDELFQKYSVGQPLPQPKINSHS